MEEVSPKSCAIFDHEKNCLDSEVEVDKASDQVNNTVVEYTVSDKSRAAYKTELETWIVNGWLIRYPTRLGLSRGLIPLMPVMQAIYTETALLASRQCRWPKFPLVHLIRKRQMNAC